MRVARQADVLGAPRRKKRGLDDRLARHRARVERRGGGGVLVHQMRQQLLVERAPVRSDPHRLAVLDGELDDLGELQVALVAEADVARIDPVFVERLGAGRMLGEQLVSDVVEVADQRDRDAHRREPVADVGNRRRRFLPVHRQAHELRARASQRRDLSSRRLRRRRCRCSSSTGRRRERRRRPSRPMGPSRWRPRRSRDAPSARTPARRVNRSSKYPFKRRPGRRRRLAGFKSGRRPCHPQSTATLRPLASPVAMQYDQSAQVRPPGAGRAE